MDIFVFRGIPGSPTVRTAEKLLPRTVDYVIDLSEYWETAQGNLFVTEEPPQEAQEAIQDLLRSESISRLAICGMLNKGWIKEMIDQHGLEDAEVHWLVVEGAQRPEDVHRKVYEYLTRSFEIDLYVD